MILPIKAGGNVLGHGSPQGLLSVVSRAVDLAGTSHAPLLIVSAFKGMTDRLEQVPELAFELKYKEACELLRDIFEEHHATGLELLTSVKANRSQKRYMLARIQALSQEAFKVLEGLQPDRTPSVESANMAKATLLSCGERLASIVVSAWARATYQVLHLPAQQLVQLVPSTTDRAYTDMQIDWHRSARLIRDTCGTIATHVIEQGTTDLPTIWLMEGYIGSAGGRVGTLRREGSDLTEILAAYAFESPAHFLKTLEPGLRSMPLGELLAYQERLGSHMIGPEAIYAALEHRVPLVVTDAETGEQYRFEP